MVLPNPITRRVIRSTYIANTQILVISTLALSNILWATMPSVVSPGWGSFGG